MTKVSKKSQTKQSCKTGVKRCTFYKEYIIEIDITGIATKDSRYFFYKECDEKASGFGETIEDCKKQIDELLDY